MATTRIDIKIDLAIDLWLRTLAAQDGRSYDDLVNEALARYIEGRDMPLDHPPRVAPPRSTLPDEDWSNRFNAALERLRANIPPDIDPAELEADIDAAVAEVREERRRARQTVPPND